MKPNPAIAWRGVLGLGLAWLLALVLCLLAQPSVSPLFKAVEADDKEGLRRLLKADASQVNQAYLGRAPMHLAALNNHLQQIRDLAAAGAKLSPADGQGDTPLHLAALARRLVVTQGLLALGADASARNAQGATPLHTAAWVGASPQLWQALLQAGADARARDGQGRAPLEIVDRLYPALAAQVRALPELSVSAPPRG